MARYGHGILKNGILYHTEAFFKNARRNDGKSRNSSGVQEAKMANHEPNEEGVYPDWADPEYTFKYGEMKIVNLFETHRNAAIHWFQNGHPMTSWIRTAKKCLG